MNPDQGLLINLVLVGISIRSTARINTHVAVMYHI